MERAAVRVVARAEARVAAGVMPPVLLPDLRRLSLNDDSGANPGTSVDGTLEDVVTGKDCSICLDPLNADSISNPWRGPGFWLRNSCTNDPSHVFHTGCIVNFAQKGGTACPECRAPLTDSILSQSRSSSLTPSRPSSDRSEMSPPRVIRGRQQPNARSVRRRTRPLQEEFRIQTLRDGYEWDPSLLTAASGFIEGECLPAIEILLDNADQDTSIFQSTLQQFAGIQRHLFDLDSAFAGIQRHLLDLNHGFPDASTLVGIMSALLNDVIIITQMLTFVYDRTSSEDFNTPTIANYVERFFNAQMRLLKLHEDFLIPAYTRFPEDVAGWRRSYYEGDYQSFLNAARDSIVRTGNMRESMAFPVATLP